MLRFHPLNRKLPLPLAQRSEGVFSRVEIALSASLRRLMGELMGLFFQNPVKNRMNAGGLAEGVGFGHVPRPRHGNRLDNAMPFESHSRAKQLARSSAPETTKPAFAGFSCFWRRGQSVANCSLS